MQAKIGKQAAAFSFLFVLAVALVRERASAAGDVIAAMPRTEKWNESATSDGFAARWLRNHLEIGLRFTRVELDDPVREEGFVGTIDTLTEQQSAIPYNVVLGLRYNAYLGIDMAWDRLRAEARTDSDNHHADGAFTDNGPTFMLVGSYPLPYGLTPYVECGLHLATADFDAEQWWALGYASPASHASLGSPGTSRGGLRRHMATESDSATGFAWGAGLLIALSEHCRLDLAVRHLDIDAETHFYITQGGQLLHERGLHPIPLSYTAYCVGMRYAF